MSKFYTSVAVHRGEILYRGYQNGRRVHRRVKYKPYLFVPSRTGEGIYRALIDNQPLEKLQFDSIRDAKEYIDTYDGVHGFEWHGLNRWQYLFINDEFPELVDFDTTQVKTAFLDIEVDSEGGFPNIREADKKITAITISDGVDYWVFGYRDFIPQQDNIEYIQCKNERDLLYRFLAIWKEIDPDIVTGWNVEGFDLPYIHKRMCNIIGEEVANSLSPWNITYRREFFNKNGQKQEAVNLYGIATLDYLALYLKFTYTKQEAYSLGYISKVELDDDKIDYRELGYENLADLYNRNHQLFMEYNVHDVRLVKMLDDKMRFLDQAVAIAYDAKINFEDSTTSVLLWDIIIHNHLMAKNIVIPRATNKSKEAQIAGAYVKDPAIGRYDWLISFDLASLYPHLIMLCNISPETLVRVDRHISPDLIMSDKFDPTPYVQSDHALAANGAVFRRDIRGVLPELMRAYYDDRTKYKKLMLQAKKDFEKDPTNLDLKRKITQYNNLQTAKKISLNSAYGATSNPGFRFYNDDLAEAITLTGQLVIRWAEREINKYMNKVNGTTDYDYVIAMDTDSLFVSFDAVVKKHFAGKTTAEIVQKLDEISEGAIQPLINRFYDELADRINAYEQRLNMKREKIAERGIWTGAKRYIMLVHDNEGVRYNEPDFVMVGIEAVRASTATIGRDIIKKGARVIIEGDQDELYKFMEAANEKFYGSDINDIARNSAVSGLKKYKLGDAKVHAACAAALTYNHLLQEKGLTNKYPLIRDGDRIKFVQLKQPNIAQQKWFGYPNGNLPDEFGLEKFIDRDELARVGYLQPLETIAEAAGLQIERKSSLADFFC